MLKAKRYKAKGKSSFVLYIFLIILLGTLVYSGYNIVEWKLNNDKNKQIKEETSQYITIEKNEDATNEIQEKISVDFESLKQRNSDVVAWIKVNNTEIDYPVVKGKDNSYYLTHNIDKEYNKAGWIFIDYRNELNDKDLNTIIYGHNMKTNLMFGTLKNALDDNWNNKPENRYLTLITEQGTNKYEIFSIYEIEAEDYSIKTNFKNTEEYLMFLNKMQERSIKNFNVELTTEDRILTLSTCTNDRYHRLVVHAKK